MRRRKWIRLDRILPLFTLVGAATVGVFALLGIIQVDVTHGIIITLLVLIAWDALIARIGTLERIESKLDSSTSSASLRSRKLMLKTPEQAAAAGEVCICAIHASSAINSHAGFLREKLRGGLKLRVVLLNPHSPNSRAWDSITHKEPGATSREIEATLSTLRMLAGEPNGHVQVKMVDFLLPFSMFGVDLERPSGEITVEYQSFGVSIDQRPHVRLLRSERNEWYDYYVDQFRMVFNRGEWIIGDDASGAVAPGSGAAPGGSGRQ